MPLDPPAETAKHVSRFHLVKAIHDCNWEEAETIIYNDEHYAHVPDQDG